ncbi:MAG: class E sortase [Actinomycetota bacterium]|nr:class E sortase [Actinomycetota bacterium]
MRIKNIVLGLFSMGLMATGVILMGSFVFGQNLVSTATGVKDAGSFSIPNIDDSRKAGQELSATGPRDKTLTVTIPKMARVRDATVPYAAGDDEAALRENAAIHVKDTGFPWQKGANVYLAGHRLGYPSTDSFLAFYDLSKLDNGDEVFVTDATGKKYTYRVFKEFIVPPTEISVTEPVEGKSILTLQTCTLPDYSKRLIVQAELVDET